MKQYRLLFFIALFLGSPLLSPAQSLSIKGSVSDTLNRSALEYAAVTLIHLPDSILSTFTRTDATGGFALHPDSAGQYVMLITFPGFADYVEGVTVKEGEPVSVGTIPMVTKAHLLTEFVLRQKGAIRIKGDTTEYLADSFTVQSGATVEDLLKKLPGLQVDRNGGVMAQGEKVEKILVDGEEFFSDDPAVVTRNLDAKAVDKVQVFDKKSDQAEFTGIDDGVKTKTINLQLKEDRKKGYFGKVATGGGTDGFFENQGMVNLFRGKQQVSAFGIAANTGKVGLGWEDREKYGGGSETHYDEETGNMYSYMSGDDEDDGAGWQGSYNGEGLPAVWTGGLHYANKWKEDKQHVAANYRYAKQNIETVGNTLTQAILPDSQYYSDERRETFNSGERHRADGLYEWKVDTSSNLKLTVNGGYSHTINHSDYQTQSRAGNGALVNENRRQLNTDGDRQSLNSSLAYRKKLAKKGRNFSINLNESYRNSTSTSFLLSRNNYYQDNQLTHFDTTDQRKSNNSSSLSINGNASYTEPLSKVAFLTVNYGLDISNSHSERLTNNRLNSEWNPETDPLFSSKYDFDVTTHTAGATLRFVYKKLNFSLGSKAFFTQFNQKDLFLDTTITRNYRNFAPSARFNYNFSRQKRMSLSYYGRTNQPTIEQIQPLRQNTDPLNISIGNPSLKQEFTNSVNFSYNSYQVLSGRYVYMGGGVSFEKDAISRSESIDSLFRRTYQYINVDGNYNGWMYGGMGMKIKKLDLQVNLNGNINIGHNINFINGVRNLSDNNTYSLGLSFEKDWEKKDKEFAGFEISPSINYNDNKSSVSAYATSFWSYELNAEAHIKLPGKFRINSQVWVNIREQTAIFDRNNNVVRWDAWVSRKFLKKDQLEVRASVFDILNQNLGYRRMGQANYITENTYNTIRRYGLLSLVWNFSKTPAGTQAPSSDED